MSTRDSEKIKSLAKEVVKECYNDKDFMEKLSDKFLAVLTKKIADELEKQLHTFYKGNNENTEKVKNELKSVEVQLNKVCEENQRLKEKIMDIENASKIVPGDSKFILNKLNDVEQKTKLSELRVFGLKEEKEEDLKHILIQCFKEKMGIDQLKIDSCYRIGKFINQAKKTRPVLVRFASVEDRNIIFKSKKKLKGTRMGIAEELTRERFELLKRAKVAFGHQNVWTSSGRICTKLNGATHYMKYLEDMEAILVKGRS